MFKQSSVIPVRGQLWTVPSAHCQRHTPRQGTPEATHGKNLPLRSGVASSTSFANTWPGPSGGFSCPSVNADTKLAWSASSMWPLPWSRSSFCIPVSVLPGLPEIVTMSFSSTAKCWARECKAALDDP